MAGASDARGWVRTDWGLGAEKGNPGSRDAAEAAYVSLEKLLNCRDWRKEAA